MEGLVLGWDKERKLFYVESHGKRLKEFNHYIEAMRYYNGLDNSGKDGEY